MSQQAAVIFECLIQRKGGSDIDMGDGKIINFRPNQKGQHVAIVSDMNHVQRLNNIPDAYKMLGIVAADAAAASAQTLNAGAAPASAALATTTATVAPVTAAQTAPVLETEPQAEEKPVANSDALDLPQPDLPDGAYSAAAEAKIREIFKVELGRTAPPKSKPETMIAQINGARAERNKGGAA